jgi:Ca2+ transporting ATPase
VQRRQLRHFKNIPRTKPRLFEMAMFLRIRAEQLVPGDIITIAVGDRIPADCRVLAIQSNSFAVDQAILTGESESVGKDTVTVTDLKAVKQDQINILFSGTTVVTGHATAIVVLTGSSTAIGDIHESITPRFRSQLH